MISYEHSSSPECVQQRQTNRWVYWIARNWLLIFSLWFGILVSSPFIAPILMKFDMEPLARIIYKIYSFLCHQLPQRSFFFFGKQFTYPLAEIKLAWYDSNNTIILRQFIGTSSMGWKVAWSDRMVSMYSSILFLTWFWFPFRKRFHGFRWEVLLIFLLPLAIDGVSHLISDFAGIGYGFRDSNAWLARLTKNLFSSSFYSGDAWGSFNSIMRLLTGFLYGVGVVGFGLPHIDKFFKNIITEE